MTPQPEQTLKIHVWGSRLPLARPHASVPRPCSRQAERIASHGQPTIGERSAAAWYDLEGARGAGRGRDLAAVLAVQGELPLIDLGQRQLDQVRMGMPGHIGERLLGHAIDDQLDLGRQVRQPGRESLVHFDPAVRVELGRQRGQRTDQPEILQQPGTEPAGDNPRLRRNKLASNVRGMARGVRSAVEVSFRSTPRTSSMPATCAPPADGTPPGSANPAISRDA